MNRSQRIELNTNNKDNDKHIKIRLERNIDTLEFLSMNVSAEDVYRDFNSDYGVLVGRVLANGGIGVPNARISIFIPLSEEDENNSDIKSIYPYKTPRDVNNDGKRYNLLPRVSKKDPETDQNTPKQPFGSFPIKEEVVTNEPILEVYKKYYKYTALTNNAGDYMIFGVPTGTQTVHLSVDITDIGEYSMNPASMVINLGYSENLFTDNNTKIKPSRDLNDLPNIETQEITVDVIPFWGDVENFEIGITQQNFRIRSTINATFTIFGSVFTDGSNSVWGSDDKDWSSNRPFVGEFYKIRPNGEDHEINIHISTKRIGKVKEKIYYYPTSISDDEIASADPIDDMLLLDPSEYSIYKRDGDFVFIINCNRNKIITDDLGNKVDVDVDSVNGVFTKFRGFVTLEITNDEVPLPTQLDIGDYLSVPTRFKLKIPQYAERNLGLDFLENDQTKKWRKQDYTFEKNKFYSLSKFHGLVTNRMKSHTYTNNSGFITEDGINKTDYNDLRNINTTGNIYAETSLYDDKDEFPYNDTSTYANAKIFGANWLNLSIHLPQFSKLAFAHSETDFLRVSTNFRPQMQNNDQYNNYYLDDNDQDIAAGFINTKFFARSDLHWTDFIEVPVNDIQAMADFSKKGFKDNDLSSYTLTGEYRNGEITPSLWPTACPLKGGKINGDPNGSPDPRYYFYKGHGEANCIQYLYELGLVD